MMNMDGTGLDAEARKRLQAPARGALCIVQLIRLRTFGN